jgi:hypothetical protein
MPPSEPYTYFQPGEIIFLLTRQSDERISNQIDNFDTVMETWISQVDGLAKVQNPDLTIIRCKDRELHFGGTLGRVRPSGLGLEYPGSTHEVMESKRHGAFSLIPVEVRLPTGDKAQCPEVVELMIHLEGEKPVLEKELNEGVYPGETAVDTILLNWLASPNSEYGGGGGPGGYPEPYQGSSGTAPYKFQIPGAQPLLTAEGSQHGQGITIAILDTAPTVHDMAAAYERYHKLNPRNRIESHPLIESLLRPNGQFHVHPASLDDLLRMRAIHLRDHNYEMSDHGLFVAGIVHTLAPRAEIHLYEVLNPDGVGDLLSIAKGLSEVLDSFQGQPLVVNCSFMLNIPLLHHPITDLDENILKRFFGQAPENGYLTRESFECSKEWLIRQAKAIEWACDQFLWQGARVVAAAGNDWKPNVPRPQARFPAAFESVLGVGALPPNGQPDAKGKYLPASYSNLSDAPEEQGVVTLGGESGVKGILGVYLGKFPAVGFSLPPFLGPISTIWRGSLSAPENTNHWAWWSGTSFATSIVTGLIAIAFSNLQRPAIAEDAIGELYQAQVVREAVTGNGEDGIIGVQQI